jgi:GNAT superfamily N-acetyltransferase
MITVRQVSADHPDALAVWEAQRADLAERYDDPDLVLDTSFPTLIGSWVGYATTPDGGHTPVASIVARWSPYEETRPGDVELKRLWVDPAHRGHGHARVMLGAAEAAARAAGATRLILETGTGQPEAIALYARTGWQRMENYGEYREYDTSRCYQIKLPTRVLVINGTIGAGKTTIAAAVHDVLTASEVRSAYIDADLLCQAQPSNPSDPYNQDLLFDNLTSIAPHYRNRGYGCIVIARVVEDERDRARYEHAFLSDAGSAEVSIVRVTAPYEDRVERINRREPEGYWRDWSLARTVELDDVLDSLELDDAVIGNAGRDRLNVAQEVIEAAGWA